MNEILEIDENFFLKEMSRIAAYDVSNPATLEYFREQKKVFAQSAAPGLMSAFNIRYESNSIKKGSIVHLKLNGIMRLQDNWYQDGINVLADNLMLADNHPNVDGIVLDVLSGGGESMAGAKLMQVIAGLQKPIVAHAYTAGSAAYHAILNVDEVIMSCDSSQAGSIGTYASVPLEFLKWYKKNIKDVYATSSPDKNKSFRDLLKNDFSTIQKEVDQIAGFFLADVKKNRPSVSSESLTGNMYYAADAIKNNLADSFGDINYAVSRLAHYKK